MTTLEARVSRLEGAFEQLVALTARVDTLPTRDEMRAEIRAHVRESEARIIKWMVGLMIAQTGFMIATAGTAVALVRLLP